MRATVSEVRILPPSATRPEFRDAASLLRSAVRSHDYSGSIESFQSRILKGFTTPSRMKGSSFTNSSAAARVLKIAMLLAAASKKSKVIIVAVMRKMIITLNAMLRDNTEWRPSSV